MKKREPQDTPPTKATAGRFFRLTYSNTSDEDPRLFQCRDGMAFNELSALLPPLGYGYGTAIHLYPDDERKLSAFPSFQPSDLLVVTTRPPLSDRTDFHPRKYIRGTKSELEAAIFAECSKYIEFCTRKHVVLTKGAFNLLRNEREAAKWKHVELFEKSGGEVMQHFEGPVAIKAKADPPYTIAFFLRANNVAGINCDLITSFGMDGYGTLIWNRIIRTRYPEWVTAPRFVMATLAFKKPIPQKPLTPEFADCADHIEVRLLT